MNSSVFNFDTIVAAIDEFKGLIEKFVDILKAFIASWKKVPAAAVEDIVVE